MSNLSRAVQIYKLRQSHFMLAGEVIFHSCESTAILSYRGVNSSKLKLVVKGYGGRYQLQTEFQGSTANLLRPLN